jgi:acyl carrier protein
MTVKLDVDRAIELVLRHMRAVLEAPALTAADHFFQSGGDSILAAQVIGRLRDELGMDIPAAFLFTYPTADELGEVLSEESQ